MTDEVYAKDVNWVERTVLKMHDNPPAEDQWRYKIWLPDWLAEWDVFANWEKERFLSMEKELHRGDILFDIGAEVGWQNIIYAQFVGAENMVLIEPTAEFWPNIKATWERNFNKPPRQCHYGLFSDKTTGNFTLPKGLFPAEAESKLARKMAYRYIHEHGKRMPQTTIDDFVASTGVVPTALTMDTEGAELLILHGAEKTLLNNDLKVWVSIHDELGRRNYGFTPDDIHKYMTACGYQGTYLGWDHEDHWYYTKAAS